MKGKREDFEIERKFLIAYPDIPFLEKKAARRLSIVQTYLCAPAGESARVRQITEQGKITFIKTIKKRISDFRRIETEEEISETAYKKLLETADPMRNPIEKTRYCVPFSGHILEIDIFPFWNDKAFLEVELSAEMEEFQTPDWLHIIREVTEDKRYTNASLAIMLPE